MAITALVLGIVSLCLFLLWFIAIPVAIAAIVFGFLGMRQCDQQEAITGKGLAVAGLVLGIIAIVFSVAIVLIGLAFMDFFEELADEQAAVRSFITLLLMR